MANLAVVREDFQRARSYAAKASELAPEHPIVQALVIPPEAVPFNEERTLTAVTVDDIKATQQTSIEMREVAGTTLLALFTHQPSATPADTRTPAANPPSLDAVLLKPIQVAPQAPLAGDSSHQGLVVEPALAVRPMEPRPSIHTNRSEPPAPLETMAMPETRDLWFNWAAAALATIGVIVLLLAVRLRLARRDTTSDALRQPIRSDDQATAMTLRRGHVFGVDVRVGST